MFRDQSQNAYIDINNLSQNSCCSWSKILYGAVLPEDLAQFSDEEIVRLGKIAALSIQSYKDVPYINFDVIGDKLLSVLTIVNGNKEFLFDSVQNVINSSALNLYMVAHPIIDVKIEDGKLCVANCSEDDSYKRLSIMQFVMEPLGEAEKALINSQILKSLNDVNAAVTAWEEMCSKVNVLADSWKKSETSKESKEVSEFLDWLDKGNFTFLSVEEYRIKDSVLYLSNKIGIDSGTLLDHPAPQDNVTISKAEERSMVHRFTWLDDIKIMHPNSESCLRLLGLFTDSAYNCSVFDVPYIKAKVCDVINRLGHRPEDHSGKSLINILERYPRDELFDLPVEQLADNVNKILALAEKPALKVLNHVNNDNSQLVTCLVYLPRTQYNVSNCEKIGQYFLDKFNGDSYEHSSFFMNSAITRIYYVVHRCSKEKLAPVSNSELEKDIIKLTHSWHDNLKIYAAEKNHCDASVKLASKFPPIYCDRFSPEKALEDADHILSLDEDKSLFVKFCPSDENPDEVGLKLYHRGAALLLSERVPLLENMGFKVIDEQTFELQDAAGNPVYMHNMGLSSNSKEPVDLSDGGELLNITFEKVWAEEVDDDAYNKLCQSAKLSPREVLILRIYGRYMQQIGMPYSQEHLAAALNNYSEIAKDLYYIFYNKFFPGLDETTAAKRIKECEVRIEKSLQLVPSLDDDLILRRFLNLVQASLRTNAYLTKEDGQLRDIIAIKFQSKMIEDIAEPKPFREIFVYGMQVEGVHLRFGPVARGGIRWSDRPLDYRTEVLGLVKAQQVKNVVIVPVGSKGGFFPRRLPETTNRAELVEAARQAYIGYIDAMLSITDNLVQRSVVTPEGVRRVDGEDPYFVVAADKGTASFSDTANAISQSRNFWLDDAFASGGSAGYDHKKMGITAKGAWEAVKRHFRELFNRDIQTTDFTVVGVGDMSGDVFGNGMLLSKHIRLVAAFDHRDIFIDPNPDAATSYAERERLFNVERSSWQDYDKSKLSKGGGIYSRSSKIIELSPEAAAAIGFEKQSGTPFEIMKAILKADVDLLWFGGIGTYIRSSSETDSDVGDRSNDKIRITGSEVRAKIIGEGANLGLTQRGRIEYSMHGGACNTDAIDNSAGVNCSDVEVNIKIALADAMRSGELNREDRDELLKEMTDEVAGLVLKNNYRQSLILSILVNRAVRDLPQQKLFMEKLEQMGLLSRRVELLPDDSELQQRFIHGQGLTRPELSIVVAYSKLMLQEKLIASDFIKDSYFEQRLVNYFPSLMQVNYNEVIKRHQLREPIIVTEISNSIINLVGPTFASRLAEKAGIDISDVVKYYIYVHDGFAIDEILSAIDKLDNKISGELQNKLYGDVMQSFSQILGAFVTMAGKYPKLVKESSISSIVEHINKIYKHIYVNISTLLPASINELINNKAEKYAAYGIDSSLAKQISFLSCAVRIPNIVLIAAQEGFDVDKFSKAYFNICSMFKIDQIEEAGSNIPTIDYYDDLALTKASDSIVQTLCQLTISILNKYDNVAEWHEQEKDKIENIRSRINALIEGDLNISRFVVSASMMLELLDI